jgi:hypothetical protein
VAAVAELGSLDHMRPSYFIATYCGRLIASFAGVSVASLVIALILGGGRGLVELFALPWFYVGWKYDYTAIGQFSVSHPWICALPTLAILALAARWKATTLIAMGWFLLNALFALWFFSVYDGKS